MNKKRRSVALSLCVLSLLLIFYADILAQENNTSIPQTEARSQTDESSPEGPGNSQCVLGWAWLDDNKDGVQGEGEDSVANVLVKLYNSTGEYLGGQLTDDVGYFLFESLQAGLYNVEVIRPFGIKFIDGVGDPTEKWYSVESVLCNDTSVNASAIPMEKDQTLQLEINIRQVYNGPDGLPCVKLNWRINDITNVYGFNILRGLTGKEENAQLFLSDIPILEGENVYNYIDILVLPGVIYDYWVEVIDEEGNTARNRPIHIQIPNLYPYSIYLPVVNNG